jgi:hypothetical protein
MQPIVAAEEAKGLKSVTSVTILAEAAPAKSVTRLDEFSKGGPKINTLWAEFYRVKAQAGS